MKGMLRIGALFLAYGVVGYGGEYAAELVAEERWDAERPRVDVHGQRYADVEVDVDVDVDPEVVVNVRFNRQSSCAFETTREVTIPASLADELAIRAGSGELVVEGRAGLDEIRAVGRVCASHEEYLDELRVTVERSGAGISLSTHYPEQRRWSGGNNTARIDLTVEIPMGLAVSIDDSSGEMVVSGTGALNIEDSSGGIEVFDIEGSLRIDDSSGGIDVRDISGDVSIEDGSGGIDVRGVQGSVLLDDGSGGIDVSGVTRDVIVEDDGSGSIRVERVDGDFRVADDGSGSIRHSEIGGEVSIPQKKERKRRRG